MYSTDLVDNVFEIKRIKILKMKQFLEIQQNLKMLIPLMYRSDNRKILKLIIL